MTKNDLAVIFTKDKSEILHVNEFDYLNTVQSSRHQSKYLYKLNATPVVEECNLSVVENQVSEEKIALKASSNTLEIRQKRVGAFESARFKTSQLEE